MVLWCFVATVLLVLPETTCKWLVRSKGVRLEARKTATLLYCSAARLIVRFDQVLETEPPPASGTVFKSGDSSAVPSGSQARLGRLFGDAHCAGGCREGMAASFFVE